MLAQIHSTAVIGVDGFIIEVQVDFSNSGLPSFGIVGLPDAAVQESRERVRAAIKNSGLHFINKRFIVNLAPADIRKQGPVYDLPIAVGVLVATDQLPQHSFDHAIFIGELGLDGSVRHVSGILPMIVKAREEGYECAFVPAVNAAQASLVPDIDVIPVKSLGELVEHIYGLSVIPPYKHQDPFENLDETHRIEGLPDFRDIKGQEHVKRALEVAAAGSHNALMIGAPGVGKTMIAKALPGILPRLSMEESLEVTRIYSVVDRLKPDKPLVMARPFRSPHHTVSTAGLIGGGSYPVPGEVSLAHRGVLFLDEFPEFNRNALEVLRQPMEDRKVTISRAKSTLTFPANFMLIAAMNPCPCGYFGESGNQQCNCKPGRVRNYQQRISGPLLDRIDIHIDVQRVDYDKLTSDRAGEPSAIIQKRVEAARAIQRKRFKDHPHLYANGDMGAGEIRDLCELTPEATTLINASLRQMDLSARAYHRILKLSRTIADLAGHPTVQVTDMAEAIQYRPRRVKI